MNVTINGDVYIFMGVESPSTQTIKPKKKIGRPKKVKPTGQKHIYSE